MQCSVSRFFYFPRSEMKNECSCRLVFTHALAARLILNFHIEYLLKHLDSPPRLKSLTTESSVIVAALQKSKTGLLEISEDKTKVRRSPDKPLPEVNDEYKDALKHKSVYIVSF